MADTRDARIAAFTGLETAIHELMYTANLLAKMENELTGGRSEDGRVVTYYASADDAATHSFLAYEVERRAQALRRDFLACYEVGNREVVHAGQSHS